jgi:spore coat protein U-like protein
LERLLMSDRKVDRSKKFALKETETLETNMKKSTVLALACMVILTACSAFAGTTGAVLTVSATVTANCTIAAQNFTFGTYDPLNANVATPLNVPGTVSLACTNLTPATILLDQGANGTGTLGAPARRMASGGNFLNYNFYQDNTFAAGPVWDGVTGVAYAGTGPGGTVTLFGSVAAGQNVAAGSYQDTVNITINF